ncbi:DUF6400 family protein [Streptomyces sp. NPDC053750]|uniref:DUF6400 family protein n=1 Tax=Streptomyces sp. NPDC053750 TaxID=3365714 RepID=UPI0037CE6025
MHAGPTPQDLPDFALDLSLDEARRRAEVVAALGPDWDPVAALRSEQEAHALLYSGLDAEQERTYAVLVAAGVLPERNASDASSR